MVVQLSPPITTTAVQPRSPLQTHLHPEQNCKSPQKLRNLLFYLFSIHTRPTPCSQSRRDLQAPTSDQPAPRRADLTHAHIHRRMPAR
jgi:hypothetical protein